MQLQNDFVVQWMDDITNARVTAHMFRTLTNFSVGLFIYLFFISFHLKDKHNSEKHRCKNLIFKLLVGTTERENVLSIFQFYSKITIRTEYKVSSICIYTQLTAGKCEDKILVKQNKLFGGSYTGI